MSVVNITNGMLGTSEMSLLNSMPPTGFNGDSQQKPLIYKSEPIAPKTFSNDIDYSTRRNVLPCKGITHHVLRPEPPPAAAGMIPIGGVGRHQGPALSQERPVDLPILPMSNPFASGFNNPLKAPN